MGKLKGSLCVQLLIWWLANLVNGFTHICDFNDDFSLEFGDTQVKGKEKVCTLKPGLLDKVVIRCGSDNLNYKLYPPKCFEQVYTSKTMENPETLTKWAYGVSEKKDRPEEITKWVYGVSTVMKRKYHEDNSDPKKKNFDDVSFRVPPNTENDEKAVYCFCENKIKIKVQKTNEEIYEKEIFNIGIAEIILPNHSRKIDGCDFTQNNSPIFTKGYDTDFYNKKNNENKNDVICKIRVRENQFIGFKCPKDYNIEPEECFLKGFNLEGQVENFQHTLQLGELIMDHYNKIFYARVPERIYQNTQLFCSCIKDDQRLTAHFEFTRKIDNSQLSHDTPDTNVLQSRNGSSSPGIATTFLIFLFSSIIYLSM
ncbi:6-cysteine protein [Plasmodium gonderi]|uniref:6-cysteine protein n=1 Tax=Plasmodium gonderi TaxID=77519 RepID=A0A1Y1JH95_PLAGO|nr:6-cysteine protein [Plasmodium gonderi]GAW81896.1 6-cysteine protein [Plasmodium gonderi]